MTAPTGEREREERIEIEIRDGEGWKPLCGGVFTADELARALSDYDGMPNPVRSRPTPSRPEDVGEEPIYQSRLRPNGDVEWGWFDITRALWDDLPDVYEKRVVVLARASTSGERERVDGLTAQEWKDVANDYQCEIQDLNAELDRLRDAAPPTEEESP